MRGLRPRSLDGGGGIGARGDDAPLAPVEPDALTAEGAEGRVGGRREEIDSARPPEVPNALIRVGAGGGGRPAVLHRRRQSPRVVAVLPHPRQPGQLGRAALVRKVVLHTAVAHGRGRHPAAAASIAASASAAAAASAAASAATTTARAAAAATAGPGHPSAAARPHRFAAARPRCRTPAAAGSAAHARAPAWTPAWTRSRGAGGGGAGQIPL